MVEDDGVGFEASKIDIRVKDAGFGLFNIRERVESAGGRFTIVSRPGFGTRIVLAVPSISAASDGLSFHKDMKSERA